MNSLKELKGVSHTNNPIKKTKGQLFKERHGISLTMAKNVRKVTGLSVGIPISDIEIANYKAERKARKKAVKREWQKRREASGVYMATKGSGKRKTKHKSRPKRGSATNRYVAPTI